MLGKRRSLWQGFTLVELMTVVAVLMVLVALALPRFKTFIARGRQAEATRNLGIIHALQKVYVLKQQGLGKGDNLYHIGMYMGLGENAGKCDDTAAGTKNTLGFRVEECDRLRYTYYTSGGSADVASNDGKGSLLIYPGCSGSSDSWDMEKSGKLINRIDIVSVCED